MEALDILYIILSLGVLISTIIVVMVGYFIIQTLKVVRETLENLKEAGGAFKDNVKADGPGLIFEAIYRFAKSKFKAHK